MQQIEIKKDRFLTTSLIEMQRNLVSGEMQWKLVASRMEDIDDKSLTRLALIKMGLFPPTKMSSFPPWPSQSRPIINHWHNLIRQHRYHQRSKQRCVTDARYCPQGWAVLYQEEVCQGLSQLPPQLQEEEELEEEDQELQLVLIANAKIIRLSQFLLLNLTPQ